METWERQGNWPQLGGWGLTLGAGPSNRTYGKGHGAGGWGGEGRGSGQGRPTYALVCAVGGGYTNGAARGQRATRYKAVGEWV